MLEQVALDTVFNLACKSAHFEYTPCYSANSLEERPQERLYGDALCVPEDPLPSKSTPPLKSHCLHRRH